MEAANSLQESTQAELQQTLEQQAATIQQHKEASAAHATEVAGLRAALEEAEMKVGELEKARDAAHLELEQRVAEESKGRDKWEAEASRLGNQVQELEEAVRNAQCRAEEKAQHVDKLG